MARKRVLKKESDIASSLPEGDHPNAGVAKWNSINGSERVLRSGRLAKTSTATPANTQTSSASKRGRKKGAENTQAIKTESKSSRPTTRKRVKRDQPEATQRERRGQNDSESDEDYFSAVSENEDLPVGQRPQDGTQYTDALSQSVKASSTQSQQKERTRAAGAYSSDSDAPLITQANQLRPRPLSPNLLVGPVSEVEPSERHERLKSIFDKFQIYIVPGTKNYDYYVQLVGYMSSKPLSRYPGTTNNSLNLADVDYVKSIKDHDVYSQFV